MLVNPKAYLVQARREGWALGGFNVFNLESARAVVEAAEEASAPVLLQTSEGAVKHAGLDNLVAMARQLTARTKAPVALHLDHGKSEELARICARRRTSSSTHTGTGCTSKRSSACSAASRISASRRCARC